MLDLVAQVWPQVAALATLAIDLAATSHAVLYKRDSRAVIAWVGFIWFVPVVGSVMYLFFGINRIQRRARWLRQRRPVSPKIESLACIAATTGAGAITAAAGASPASFTASLGSLARLVSDVTGRPLVAGNRVEPLHGDRAYQAMLKAIDEARRSIALATYIFDNDQAGAMFAEALGKAVSRGVETRVLIDDVGARYSWPSIIGPLRRRGIPVARFLPKLVPWATPYANLRNHRKLLVVDGRIAFTGGMNIREGHDPALTPKHPIQDLHFQVEGPVVGQMQAVFAADWAFTTGEELAGEPWATSGESAGPAYARGISDGPDDDFEKLRLTILGALSCAQTSVRIVTPYFLPDAGLISALNVTAMRGVEVDIILPAENNLRLVQWASTAQLWQVLERGCHVWLTPPPFDHTKLMVVDGQWSLFGSANWDPRSLRLNFEFNVECFDAGLAGALERLIREKLAKARRLTLADVDNRPLVVKLRDGVARLATPYL